MIKYSLKCAQGHTFESWFASAEAFDALDKAGHLGCAICGSSDVVKAMMAPRVRPGRNAVPKVQGSDTVPAVSEPPSTSPSPLSKSSHPAEQALRELRRKVEENSTYVGKDFAREARAMHLGETPERAIHGEAKPAEAKELLKEGVPVLPLPFSAGRKTN